MAQNKESVAPKVVKGKKSKVVKYNRWGYIFLIPFIATFLVFTMYPLVNTIYNSLFEHYVDGLEEIGPTFVGFENYKKLFTGGRIWKYAANTGIMWVMGFIPQILVAILLAQWFSDTRLRLKGSSFFKTVIYMPNLIMASAFAMLFFVLFADKGPINNFIVETMHWRSEPFKFMDNVWSTRTLVAIMNFLMWFGNTTILLMAGIMGIDTSLYEAAEVDGANSWQRFTKITLPLLKPILVYVMITSLIGGIQMFDVPNILTNKRGTPTESTYTLIMWLDRHIGTSKNYGMGGALSVVLFILTGVLSLVVYFIMYRKSGKEAK